MNNLQLNRVVETDKGVAVAVLGKKEGFEIYYIIEYFSDVRPKIVDSAWSETAILIKLNLLISKKEVLCAS